MSIRIKLSVAEAWVAIAALNVSIKAMDQLGDHAGASAVEDIKNRIKAQVMTPDATPAREG